MSDLHVVGFDQSLASFGIAAIYGEEVAVWRLRPGNLRGHERLDVLLESVRNAACGADVIAMEGLAFGAKGDAMTSLAGLFWMVRHELWKMHVPYVVINSSHRRKWITGSGVASKDEVLAAAIKRFPMVDLRGNDEADALVLAAMTADHYGIPIAQMPADRAALLNGVHTVKAKRGQPLINWPPINTERG